MPLTHKPGYWPVSHPMTTGMTTRTRRFSNPFNPTHGHASTVWLVGDFIHHFSPILEVHMFWYFTSSIIIGLIVYTLGTYTVKVSMFMITFKVIATALVIAALILLYRKFRSHGRAGRRPRLGR
jgi:hypothetical protein